MSVWQKLGLAMSIILFIIALIGVEHHYLVSDRWFDIADMAHHEPIIVAVASLGMGVLLGSLLRR